MTSVYYPEGGQDHLSPRPLLLRVRVWVNSAVPRGGSFLKPPDLRGGGGLGG